MATITIPITAQITAAGAPLTSPTSQPVIYIWRTDSGLNVVNGSATTSITDTIDLGVVKYDFSADTTLDYQVTIDADPNQDNGLTAEERYYTASVSGLSAFNIDDLVRRLADEYALVDSGDSRVVTGGLNGPGTITTPSGATRDWSVVAGTITITKQ